MLATTATTSRATVAVVAVAMPDESRTKTTSIRPEINDTALIFAQADVYISDPAELCDLFHKRRPVRQRQTFILSLR